MGGGGLQPASAVWLAAGQGHAPHRRRTLTLNAALIKTNNVTKMQKKTRCAKESFGLMNVKLFIAEIGLKRERGIQ